MRQELKKARNDKRFTQQYVADKVGITRTIYCSIERGKTKTVDVKTALKISKLLKQPVEKIFLLTDSHDVHKTS